MTLLIPSRMTDKKPETERAEDEASWLLPEPKADLRVVVRSFRLTAQEAERLDGAARAMETTASSYVRTRVLNPGLGVVAWRAVYKRLAGLVAECKGSDAEERVCAFKQDFEQIALTLPAPDDGEL